MDTFTKRAIFLALGLIFLSIAPAAYAWAQSSRLSLPLPKALSIITLFFPVLAPALVPLLARYFRARQNGVNLPAVLAYLVSVVPVILLVLSSIFGFRTSLFRCSLESQWQHLFQIKDGPAIRAIQDTLRCCGFNSVQDRAWPFPSKTVGTEACERTQGWNVRCLDPWERQESTAAGMVGLANLSSWALVILLVYITRIRPQRLQLPNFGILDDNRRARLLAGLGDCDTDVHEEPSGGRTQAYSDGAGAGDGGDQENRV